MKEERMECLSEMNKPLHSTISNEEEKEMLQESQIYSPSRSISPSPSPSPEPRQSERSKLEDLEDRRLDIAFEILMSCVNSDECQEFSNMLAKKMRKFEAAERSMIQYDIMGLIVKADKGFYKQSQNDTPSTSSS